MKPLDRLLDGFEGKLTSSKWAAIAKCSPDTALRDIDELIVLGVPHKTAGGGRSTAYALHVSSFNWICRRLKRKALRRVGLLSFRYEPVEATFVRHTMSTARSKNVDIEFRRVQKALRLNHVRNIALGIGIAGAATLLPFQLPPPDRFDDSGASANSVAAQTAVGKALACVDRALSAVAADGKSATFACTVNGIAQAKQLVPQEFAQPVPTCVWGAQPDLTLATNYLDLWWATNGSEAGWGINFTHHGNVIFATWFTYDANGNATITIGDGNHAKFDYTVSGIAQSKNLTRQVFAPPGPCANEVNIQIGCEWTS